MIRIILCEGETDAVLLGLYLEKVRGWTYEKKPKIKLNIPKTIPAGNEKAETYSNKTDELIICAVGGKDNFGYFYKKYIKNIIALSQNGETDFRIALMTDSDDRDINSIESDILTQLAPDISTLKNNSWKLNAVQNTFNVQANVEFLLTVIPQRGQGALETVLMDALAEQAQGDIIVSSGKSFVDSLPANEYLPTDRLKLKAKLGVALSIFYPDKVFSQFDQQLQIVDWGQSATLAECLSELVKI